MSSGTYLDGADGGPDWGHVRHGGGSEVGVGADVGEGGGLLGGVELGLARVSRGSFKVLGSEIDLSVKYGLVF